MFFAATAVTCTIAGAGYSSEEMARAETLGDLFTAVLHVATSAEVLRGWVFSVPLMAILLVHEMGHYLSARRRFMDVTLPYFIPGLPFLIGTFGAFIKIRTPVRNRGALVEIGASGPIAGAIVAIPLLLVGLSMSHYEGASVPLPFAVEGSSLILELLCWIRFGDFSFNGVLLCHPTAMAAWFGLFVTALNLLPIGQLDGGHVIYALFGPRVAKVVSGVFFMLLVPMGLVWPGWVFFGLLVFFLGLRHPPPMDPYTPLGWKRRLLGCAAIVLFLLTFVPVPSAASRLIWIQ